MSDSSPTADAWSLRIGEVAARTGVSVRSVRYYEQQGLLPSVRTAGGHRVFPDAAVDRVIRIQELFAAGLSSRRIYQILPCLADSDGGRLPATTGWVDAELRAERARLDRSIGELQRARDVLDEVIAASEIPTGAHVHSSAPR